MQRPDLVLVGGGLANGLIAHLLHRTRPDLRLMILEVGTRIGGNHLWSFHEGDVTAAEAADLAPFVAHSWPAYDVRFPRRRRRIATGYRSVPSDRFAEVLEASLPPEAIRTGTRVAALTPSEVTFEDGTGIAAGAVIDGRGPQPSPHLVLGFQKFLGLEVELDAPHGLDAPIVMDATVDQHDGYRFVYVLPLGPRRLHVEDTYYADGEALPADALRRRIEAYCEAAGWRIATVLREETGILPIAQDGDIAAFWRDKAGVPASGLSAALFHPTTGYSLPDALRLARRIAAAPDLSPPALFALTRAASTEAWAARGFFRLLNRLLFLAGKPEKRYEILQHFHRLPDGLIARFYAGRITGADKLRIFAGRPPVPLSGALKVLAMPPRFPRRAA